MAILRPGTSSVDPRWLMHAINSPDVRSAIEQMQAGTTRRRISRKNLETISVLVPPVAEQRRIATELDRRLSHVDTSLRYLRAARLRLEAVRSSVRGATANGSLLDLDWTDWDDTTTGQIGEVRGGIQKQPKRQPLRNTRPFLRVANVGRGKLDLTDVHQIELFDGELPTYQLKKGDLLVVEGNGSVDQIGRAAMWDGSIPECVHQNHLIRVRPGDDLVPEFLALVWNAPSTIEQLKAVASSTSGLHTLSTGKVKSVRLKLPDIDVQSALVAEAARRLSLIDTVEMAVTSSLVNVEQLRRSLLTTALRGRLVPQDPDDERADALLNRIRGAKALTAPQRKARRVRRENAA